MQGWQRFDRWRQSDRDLRRLVDKIEAARRDWQSQREQRQYLLEGRLLKDAKQLLKNRSTYLGSEARSFVDRSLQHQQRRRIQSAGWLLIPVFLLVIPVEYAWREEVVRQSYRIIRDSKGTPEETNAVLRRYPQKKVPKVK